MGELLIKKVRNGLNKRQGYPSICVQVFLRISKYPEAFIFVKNLLWAGLPKANDGIAKSDGGDVRGTWLQLVCCTLPEHLCP